MAGYYRPPNWLVRYVLNPQVTFTTWLGVGPGTARVLAVKGRKSGQWRTVPVNLLTHDGQRYLVSPRGETQWVRNLRAVGDGELRRGMRAERFRARELSDAEKVAVLRAYLKKWAMEMGIFFQGIGARSSDEEILAIAPKHPTFEVVPVSSADG
jgi:deazaflavin-dependent oxidoreductase (nitroreductase family)